jgi:methylenetetrahydrofolate dehydrogenase (NADP+)/methenyltetrahydrofolate cyclohydrolase
MIIDGRHIAKTLEQELAQILSTTPKKRVAFVLFGNDSSSIQFIGIKSRVAQRLGIETKTFQYEDINSTEQALLNINEIISESYDGIVVQLPLPVGMDTQVILNSIPAQLDIDVLGDEAKSKYISSSSHKIPPVAAAVQEIITSINIDLKNKKVLVIGNGKLVGEPVGIMLSHDDIVFDIVDKDTDEQFRNEKIKNADVVISGVGIPHVIKSDMIQPGVILIDAGTSEQSGKLAGDIDPACAEVASYITPVPGGVGPITVVALFRNLL